MGMVNWIIIIGIVLFVWNGYRVGLVYQLIKIIGFAASYYVAITYANNLLPSVSHIVSSIHALQPNQANATVATSIESSAVHSLAYAISFAILFGITYFIVRVIGMFVGAIASLPLISIINRLLGAVIGVVYSVLAGAVILHILILLPLTQIHILIGQSQLANTLLQLKIWPKGLGKIPSTT